MSERIHTEQYDLYEWLYRRCVADSALAALVRADGDSRVNVFARYAPESFTYETPYVLIRQYGPGLFSETLNASHLMTRFQCQVVVRNHTPNVTVAMRDAKARLYALFHKPDLKMGGAALQGNTAILSCNVSPLLSESDANTVTDGESYIDIGYLLDIDVMAIIPM